MKDRMNNMNQNLTQHQNKGLQVIKASAGSGKTYTLAKLYIEQLLWRTDPETGATTLRTKEKNYHEHILAITFTNKATDEMKRRIVDELYKLWQGQSKYMKDFLARHQDSEQQIQEAAHKALKEVLFNYQNFHVSTIDSFFQTVLRTFAHELDCDYDYELQLDEKYAIGVAVRKFLMNLGKEKANEHISKWVKEFVKDDVVNNGEWNFFSGRVISNLKKLAEAMNMEAFVKCRAELLNYLQHSGSGLSPIQQFKQAVLNAAQRYKDAYAGKPGTGLSPDDFGNLLSRYSLDESNLASRSALRYLLTERDPEAELNKTLIGYTLDDIANPKKCFKGDVSPSACEAIIDFRDSVIQSLNCSKALNGLVNRIWQLGMLAKIDEQLENFRKDNNSLLISDTNELIATVLKSGVPFMYERMGTWLNHFMIDEFQDTSTKQYENFTPLLDQSLGSGYSNLIIGDEKQSIYRFRNSDPDLLQYELKKKYGLHYDDSLALEVNYRSCENIVTFNNIFFRALIDAYVKSNARFEKLANTYSHLKQLYSGNYDKLGVKGYVRVNYVYDFKDGPKRLDAEGNAMKSKDQILSQLPAYILNLHQQQQIGYEDMLVLVSTHSDGNAVVERLLEHNQTAEPGDVIDVVSGESLRLKNSPAVRLVVSVLRLIDATQYSRIEDDSDGVEKLSKEGSRLLDQRLSMQYQYRVLHDFVNAVSDQAAQPDCGDALAKCFEKCKHVRELSVNEQLESFANDLTDVLPQTNKELMSLVGVVEKIIDKYVLTQGRFSAKANGKEADESSFLMAFQDCVINFAQQAQSGGTVHEFLRYWDEQSDHLSVPSSESSKAVSIMTIHAAKGLERKCVIIPFACWDMVTFNKTEWVEKDVWMSNGDPVAGVGTGGNDAIVPPLIPVDGNFLKLFPQFEDHLATIMQDSLIDNINKTYVAFTRPRQHLHIFAIVYRKECDMPESAGDWLHKLMPSLEDVSTHYFEPDADVSISKDGDVTRFIDYCELGENEKGYKDEDEGETESVEKESLPQYYVKSALPMLKVRLPKDSTVKQREGMRLHYVFSLINYPGDEEFALRCAQKMHIVDEDDTWTTARLQAVFSKMLNDEVMKQWFAPDNKVLNERSIITATELSFNKYRPDRVVMRPDGEVIVVDYKFGSNYSPRVQAINRDQVENYVNLLRNMGYERVKGYLWYVRLDRLVTVGGQGHQFSLHF